MMFMPVGEPLVFEDPAPSVVWVKGSLLPHASTWWTVQRFILLNQPTRAEFCADVGSMKIVDGADLFNNRGAFPWVVCHSKLANVLGEPEHFLDLGSPSGLPDPARRLFLSFPRLCPKCAELGYHSILMSLNGIDKCPLHGCAFVEACDCGTKFPRTFAEIMITPGRCFNCDKVFLDQRALYKPKINESELADYIQLGGWVNSMCRWLISPHIDRGGVSALRDSWLAGQWERNPKITPYELLMRLFSTQHTMDQWHGRVTRSHSGPLGGRSEKTSSGIQSEILPVYGAISRYIRRHAAGPDFKNLSARLSAIADADRIHQIISTTPAACLVWRYILWRMQVERRGSFRDRWNSARATCFDNAISECATEVEPAGHKNIRLWASRDPRSPLGLPHIRWHRLHAAETALISLWRALATCVQDAMETGDVAWGDGLVDRAHLCDWIGMREMQGKGARKTAYAHFIDVRTPGEPLTPWAERPKESRRLLARVRDLAKQTTFATSALRVSEALDVQFGPATVPSVQPQRVNLRTANGRLKCVVFRQGVSWVARFVHWRIEAAAPTRFGALATLRRYHEAVSNVSGSFRSNSTVLGTIDNCPLPEAGC